MDGDLYKVLRLRPTDILVMRLPEKLRDGGAATTETLKGRLAAAGVTVADVWVLDGGAEIEVIAVEDVEDER